MPAKTNVSPTKASMTFCIFMTLLLCDSDKSSATVSTGIAFRQQQFAQRSSLLVASDSRCQTTTARYKCNRVANTMTLNPQHLLKEDRADNSDVPKIQRESIRTRRERLHDMRVNIERTLAVGVSQELLNGFDIFSNRLQQGDEGVAGRIAADLLVNAICLRNRPDFTL